MIVTKAPVGEIITFLNKNSNIYREEEVVDKVEKLVDLITIRIKKYGITQALENLVDDIFELRFTVINNPELVGRIFTDLNYAIQDRIQNQFNRITRYEELELAFLNSIDIYGQMADSIIAKVSSEPFIAINKLSSFQYKDLVKFLESLPGRESHLISLYIRASINLDYALITAELIFDGQIKLKDAELKTLQSLIKDSIEDFAIYSKLFGLWEPNEEDESQWIRNIKIRISAVESTLISANSMSTNEIDKIIAA